MSTLLIAFAYLAVAVGVICCTICVIANMVRKRVEDPWERMSRKDFGDRTEPHDALTTTKGRE